MEQQAGIQTRHHIVQHDPPAVFHAPVDDVGGWDLNDIKEPEGDENAKGQKPIPRGEEIAFD